MVRNHQTHDMDRLLVRILLPVVSFLIVYLLNDLSTKINKALDNQAVVLSHIAVVDQKVDYLNQRQGSNEDRLGTLEGHPRSSHYQQP